MKKIAIISALTILVAITLEWCYHSPKKLTSSADHIPEFFELPPNAVRGMTVIDELHSQGKTTFSFGINHYWLKFQVPNAVVDAISNAGGIEIDSVWSITKQRGNYIGIFSVSLKDNTGHLRYAEFEE